MSLMETLKTAVSSITDPHARRLGGEAFAAWLRARPTSAALEALAADTEFGDENRRLDDEAHATLRARCEREAAAAMDEGRSGLAPLDLDKEPEMLRLVDALDDRAASLGLRHRGQLAEHLHDRRGVLVRHLEARYAAEGPPAEVAELRRELHRLAGEGWALMRALKDARERYALMGGSAGLGDEAVVAEAVKAANANSQAQDVIRRRLAAEFGITK